MRNISKMAPKTQGYLQNLKQSNMLKPSVKPEISPSAGKEVNDKTPDTLSLGDITEESGEFVEVILATDNPLKRKSILASNLTSTDPEIPRMVNVEGSLGGGEVVAKVDKKVIANLEKAGFKVISNKEQLAIPLFPEASKARRTPRDTTVLRDLMKLNMVNATTKIDELKATGKGVSIAILDTGVAPHPDINDKIVAFKDFVNGREEPYDDNGHGTHVSGDAAGTGKSSDGKYKGTAPEANIVGVKVLNQDGGAKISDIIRGIDWVIENRDQYNIRVINMSIGVPSAGYKFDPIHKAVERAVKAGIVVVAAAGNEGPTMGTVGGAPGNSPFALTIGALDDKNTPEKDDDIIAPFSSRGPTIDGISKPDLVAPGTDIVSLNIKGSQVDKMAKAVKYLKELPNEKLKELPAGLYEGLGLDSESIMEKTPSKIRRYLDTHLPNLNYVNEYYVGMPGTSMAAPITAGVVADMLEANPRLSPEQVKDILKNTADDMGKKTSAQGAGSIDPKEAIYVAFNTRGDLPQAFEGMGYLISGSGGNSALR